MFSNKHTYYWKSSLNIFKSIPEPSIKYKIIYSYCNIIYHFLNIKLQIKRFYFLPIENWNSDEAHFLIFYYRTTRFYYIDQLLKQKTKLIPSNFLLFFTYNLQS